MRIEEKEEQDTPTHRLMERRRTRLELGSLPNGVAWASLRDARYISIR